MFLQVKKAGSGLEWCMETSGKWGQSRIIRQHKRRVNRCRWDSNTFPRRWVPSVKQEEAEAIVNLPKADWHRYRQMAAKAISGAEWLLDWHDGKKTV